MGITTAGVLVAGEESADGNAPLDTRGSEGEAVELAWVQLVELSFDIY